MANGVSLREFQVDFEGMAVHCYEGGAGFPILLLHGSGAGTSSISNWALVLDDLARHYHVLAADLIGFGLSARKTEPPYFDLAMWVRQAQFLFDRVAKGGAAGIVGHSISGFLALRLAASNDNLVKLAVTGCPGAPLKLSRELDAAWSFPESPQKLREMYACVVADPSNLTDDFYASRLQVLNAGGYPKYFSEMFGGDKQAYLAQLVLTPAELTGIRSQVVFIHGVEDRVVPFAEGTLPLLRSIEAADAVLLGNCGHGPALEQPRKFLNAIHGLFG
ncbi:MAG: hydrolase [Gammaproteobacteria bacterium]|nr:hydrolase [Gammaproteobacteria bacterium]